MMRIIILSPLPLPGNSSKGGVEAVTLNLLEGLSIVENVSILVLSFHKNLEHEVTRQLYENVFVKYIPYGIIKSTKFELLFHSKKILYKYFDEFKADLIHIQGNGSSLLVFNNRYANRIILTQHGVLHEEIKYINNIFGKANHRLNILIEAYFKNIIQNWIFISKYNMTIARECEYKFVNIAQIYNPLSSKFYIEKKSGRLNKTSLYYVGSIIRRKGLHDLLKAIVQLKKRNVIINTKVFGGFTDKKYEILIKNFIRENKLDSQIVFLGWRTSEEIIELTSDAPIFVLPSYQETLPVVIAEAMAMGKIVVATNISGIPEMIEDGISGVLYEKGNVKQLSNILYEISSADNLLLDEIGINAQKAATNKFSPTIVAKQTVNFYKKILQNN